MNLPFYSYLPVVAGIIGGIIGGVIYKKNRRKKEK
jgi:glycerol uptake facilitator-like aquaporin